MLKHFEKEHDLMCELMVNRGHGDRVVSWQDKSLEIEQLKEYVYTIEGLNL